MIDEAGGNLAVASRRLMESVDAEFPEDNEKGSSSALEAGKAAFHAETTSNSSIEEYRRRN